jgi:glucose/arabinose dehydrogenase
VLLLTARGPVGARLAAVGVALLGVAAGCSSGADGATAGVDPTLPPTPIVVTEHTVVEAGPSEASPAAPAGSSAASPAGSPTASPPPSAPPAADPDPAAAAVALEPWAEVEAPTATAVRPGDPALYVAERAGRVRPIAPDGAVGDPVLDLSERTTTDGERGLLGIAWSPDGDVLYVSSTDGRGATLLEAHDVVDGVLQPDGREVLRVPQPAANHNGGQVAVGPDGHVWLALGDGGGADDEFGHGQDPTTLLGSLLRLDVEGAADGQPYAIPADNPFAGGAAPGGVEGAPEVWAYGLRNPWRFSFDPPTGALWVADVGQDRWEEVDRVPADAPGLNYGWPRFEGDRPFDGQPADGPVVEPVHVYEHGPGCSVTGGVVYRGGAIPALQGAYLFSDFCDGTIRALDLDAGGAVTGAVDLGVEAEQVVSFGTTPEGEVVVLSLDGAVLRLVPR